MTPTCRMPRALLPFLLLGLGLPGPAAAQVPGGGAQVVLEGPDGKVTRVAAVGFSSPDPREHGAVLVRYEGLSPLAPTAPAEVLVELVSGDRVRGRVLGGEGEDIHLEIAGGSRLPLAIEEVARLAFDGRVPAAWAGRLEPAEEGDRVYFARGGGLDRVDGTLLSFDAEGLSIDSALGTFQTRWHDVAVIFVAPLGAGPARPAADGVPVVVDLVDGSRLAGQLVRLGGDEVLLRTPGGRGVRLVAAAVAEVFVQDGRLAFLSDLAPSQVEEGSPFGDELGLVWPHRRDRSVSGNPLTAGGRQWSRGLGVHAPSRLTWDLDGRWSWLRGHAGIDDEVLRLPARGSVRFRVLVDGQERWASRVVRGGEAPLALPEIDLTGARRLTLEVDMADELHVADRANWLRPILVRREEGASGR